MHTPISFDYDLWTSTENETKHYWARVKSTGEVAEVSHDVMKYLRASEKALRRSLAGTESTDELQNESQLPAENGDLSLDFVLGYDEAFPAWLADPTDCIANAMTLSMEAAFLKLLTPYQLDIYNHCLKGGMSIRAYAKQHQCHHSSVEGVVRAIQKKFENFYFDTPPKSK